MYGVSFLATFGSLLQSQRSRGWFFCRILVDDINSYILKIKFNLNNRWVAFEVAETPNCSLNHGTPHLLADLSEVSPFARGKKRCLSVCLLVVTITLERGEIQTRALRLNSLSCRARLLLKFSSLAQFIKAVVIEP